MSESTHFLRTIEGRKRASALEAEELTEGNSELANNLAPFLEHWAYVEADVRSYFNKPGRSGEDSHEAAQEIARLNLIKAAKIDQLLSGRAPNPSSPE